MQRGVTGKRGALECQSCMVGWKFYLKNVCSVCRGDLSTTEKEKIFIAKGHGHIIIAGFMLAINN